MTVNYLGSELYDRVCSKLRFTKLNNIALTTQLVNVLIT